MIIHNIFDNVKQALSPKTTFAVSKQLCGLQDGKDGAEHHQGCLFCNKGQDRFWYSSAQQTFHCRQCNINGWDIIGLVAQYRNIKSIEAAKLIAATVGISIEPVPLKPQAAVKSVPKPPLTDDTAIPLVDWDYTNYLYRQYGKPSVMYDYRTPDGILQYSIYRWNKPDGSKIVRPDRKGLTVHNRIPYQLEYLTGAAEIWIVEGEKCADALNSDFAKADADSGIYQRVATTVGASSYTAIWERSIRMFTECFYFGTNGEQKPVFIIPDNDDAGLKSAKETASIFREFGFSVVITSTVSTQEGGDYADIK